MECSALELFLRLKDRVWAVSGLSSVEAASSFWASFLPNKGRGEFQLGAALDERWQGRTELGGVICG